MLRSGAEAPEWRQAPISPSIWLWESKLEICVILHFGL